MQKPRRKGFGIFIIVGLVAAAIFVIVLFSGFSIGSLTTSPNNPFGPGEVPPRIMMVYEGQEYEGELRGYVYDRLEPISELPNVNHVNLTEISTEAVNVIPGSELTFVVRGNPEPEAQHNSLAVTAATADGQPVAVLNPMTPHNDTFTINRLDEGREYVLSAVATWAPDAPIGNEINGYVIYGYRINVTDSPR